jgi:hypothetical protein
VSPSQIPSSPSIGDSLPANSTAPNSVLHHRAVPASRPKSGRSLSVSQERTPSGVTTPLSELWPISATPSPIRRRATSFAGTGSNRHRDEAKIPLEGFHRLPPRRLGRYRLLHCCGAYLARSRHLLRPVLHSSGIAPGHPRRLDQTSYLRVDAPDGSQCHRRECRGPPWPALPSPRSRYEVLLRVSGRPTIQWHTAISSSSAQSEFERFGRALGGLRASRMPIQAHPLWRRLVTPCIDHTEWPYW